MPDGIESMNDFSDIFNGWAGGMQSPGGSPGSEGQRRGEEGGTSRPGSPGRPANHHGAHSPMSDEGNARVSLRSSLYNTIFIPMSVFKQNIVS